MARDLPDDTQDQRTMGPILLRGKESDIPTRLGVLSGTQCNVCGQDYECYVRVHEHEGEFNDLRCSPNEPAIFTIGVCGTMDCEMAEASDISDASGSDEEGMVQRGDEGAELPILLPKEENSIHSRWSSEGVDKL